MAQLLRGYPGRGSGLHNATVVAPAVLAFLPTGPKKMVAVSRGSQSSLLRPLSTRLRPPKVIFYPPVAMQLPTASRVLYASRRAAQSSNLRPTSTALRKPAVINAAPNLFLPTAARVNIAVSQSFTYQRLRRNSTKLFPATIINQAAAAPAFLPTLPRLFTAIPRALQSSVRQPLSTKLRPPAVINPTPNFFLPTGSRANVALRQRLYTPYLKTHSKLSPPTIINPAPNLFLPTLGRFTRVAVFGSHNPVYNKTKSHLLHRVKFIYPPAFLPTVKVKLTAQANTQNIVRAFRYHAKVIYVYTLPAAPPFLPTGVRTNIAVTHRLNPAFNKTKAHLLHRVKFIPQPAPFLPTGVHTNIAVRHRLNPLFNRTKAHYLHKVKFIPQPSAPPPFLPTRARILWAVPRAAQSTLRDPQSTILRKASVINPFVSPNFGIPFGVVLAGQLATDIFAGENASSQLTTSATIDSIDGNTNAASLADSSATQTINSQNSSTTLD